MTSSDSNPRFFWTTHPLIDMGIAALAAFAGRNAPEEITEADLEEFVRYAEQAYFSPELASYLTVLFTSNFINPSFTAAKKTLFVKEILATYKAAPDEALPPCAYCGRPSVRLAHRDLIPMLTGREAVNFFPGGSPGLALCGHCVLALQALSIGAPMVSGRALIVFADDPRLTLQLVKAWQPEIRKRIQLSQQTGEKLAPVTRPLTRAVEALATIEAERAERHEDERSSITVYHLSNSGQGPQVDLYFLPSSVVRFVERAQGARYAATWRSLVKRAWQLPPKPKKGEVTTAAEPGSLRNYLYEDLFYLPERAGRFLRVYFLRRAAQILEDSGEMRSSSPFGGEDDIAGLWELTGLFLQEVMGMDSGRIAAIRKLGDTLADEIEAENDRGLWFSSYKADSYRAVRLTLIKVSKRRLARRVAPVVSFDEFLEVFEEGEDLPRVDWRLAWDLVLIRVIEKLYEMQWFEKHKDVLEEEESEVEVKEA